MSGNTRWRPSAGSTATASPGAMGRAAGFKRPEEKLVEGLERKGRLRELVDVEIVVDDEGQDLGASCMRLFIRQP